MGRQDHIRMFRRIIFIFILAGASVHAQTDAYSKRCDSVLTFLQGPNAPVNSFTIMARLNKGVDLNTSMMFVDSFIGNPSGDMFWQYQVAGMYFFGQKNLDAAAKEKIQKAFRGYEAYRGNTENHWLQYYASIYLMASEPGYEQLPWFNGKTNQENLSESKEWLKHWMKEYTSKGSREFDSPHYGGWYLVPVCLLYDFSKDNEMRGKAEIMMNWILVDYLSDFSNYVHAGANSRVHDPYIFRKEKTHTSLILNFLLGERPIFNSKGKGLNMHYHLSIFALSQFRLHPVISGAYASRIYPFVNSETHRSMPKIRFTDNSENIVKKTNYISSGFALGSVTSGNYTEIQSRCWSLDWINKDGSTGTFFGLHAYYSENIVSAWFPGEPSYVLKDVCNVRPNYCMNDKWVGGSPFEKLFQYKNTLIGTYELYGQAAMQEISFHLPDHFDSVYVDTSGLMCVETDTMYFAVRFHGDYELSAEKSGQRIRIKGKNPGFILEVTEKKNFPSLMAFLKDFDSRPYQFAYEGIHYKNGSGEFMDLFPNGTALVNDKPLKVDNKYLINNPGVKAGKGIMKIKHGKASMTMDINKSKIIIR